jgi:hypothetical protein
LEHANYQKNEKIRNNFLYIGGQSVSEKKHSQIKNLLFFALNVRGVNEREGEKKKIYYVHTSKTFSPSMYWW